MFNLGDYVKIKPNRALPHREVVNDWVGQIEDFFEDEAMYLVLFDAPTIDQLSDAWIMKALEEGAEPFMELFDVDELELTTRRDTDDQMRKALDNLSNRALALEEQVEELRDQHNKAFISQFKESPFFHNLTAIEQEQTAFILQNFIETLYLYERITIDEWSVEAVTNCCLDVIPSTFVADEVVFGLYGTVVLAFLQFLKNGNLLPEADALMATVEKLSPQIPQKARKKSDWTAEKRYLMQAKAAGIEFKDQEEANAYVLEKHLSSNRMTSSYSSVSLPKLGRNEKITVQYKDGRVVENVKFKKVKNDLERGLCTILSQ